jgi:hypothetical protein
MCIVSKRGTGRCSILEFQPKKKKKEKEKTKSLLQLFHPNFFANFFVNFLCAVGEGTIGTSE